MKSVAAACALALLSVAPSFAQREGRVREARDVVLQLCIASGSETITVASTPGGIQVTGRTNSLQITRTESTGLVGGLSKEITTLSAQQASEARQCTQKYLKQVLDIILQDVPPSSPSAPSRPTPNNQATIWSDPDAFWGGNGIWQDNQNYCSMLLEFLSVKSTDLTRVRGGTLSLDDLTSAREKVVGNFIIKTEPGSTARFCGAFKLPTYNALACSRVVGTKPGAFASVYNQTLQDIRHCLLPRGWRQTSIDQGACLPTGTGRGECIRRFSKGSRDVFLFSNIEAGTTDHYSMGLQTELER